MNDPKASSRKGCIAVAKVMADLAVKDIPVLTPFDAALPFDLVVYMNGKFIRLQVKYNEACRELKYRSLGYIGGGKTRVRKYASTDFDYYAVYYPQIDRVLYPSISFMGNRISIRLPNALTPFYWWEDFLDFTDTATRRTLKDFGKTMVRPIGLPYKGILRPARGVLEKLLWEKPTTHIAAQFGVSDVAIGKWATQYGLSKPGPGYWRKKQSGGIV